MKKRVLSLALVLTMLMSLLAVPVGAATPDFELRLDLVGYTYDEDMDEITITDATLNPDSWVALAIVLKNNTTKPVSVSNAEFEYTVNDGVFELNPVKGIGLKTAFYTTHNASFEGTLDKGRGTAGMISSSGISVFGKGKETTLGYVLMKLGTDVEKGEVEFKIDDTLSPAVKTPIDKNTTKPLPIDFSKVSTKVMINGTDPVLDTVTLAQKAVTVDGETAVPAIQASAFSKKGTNMTDSVKWSVDPADKGVAVDAKGAISVDPKAAKGTFNIKAAAADAEAFATLTVDRAASKVASAALTADKNEITIPADTATNSASLTAVFKDQFGDAMNTAGMEITWSLSEKITGVTLAKDPTDPAKAELQVTEAAADTITEPKQVTVKVSSDGKEAEAGVTIQRETPVLKTLTIEGAGTVAVPTAGNKTSETYTVKGFDQYGAKMTVAAEDVTWLFGDAGTNTVFSKGTLTVDPNSKAGQVSIRAKVGDVSTEALHVTVTKAASVATTVKLYRDTTKLGDTDTVIIPTTDTPNTYTYTAKVFDQFGAEMEGAAVTWSAVLGESKMTFADGTLTVNKDSTGSVTLTAKAGEAEATITVTAVSIVVPAPEEGKDKNYTVKEAPTYGDNWSDIITITNKNVDGKLGDTSVPGEYYLKTTGRPDAGTAKAAEIWFRSLTDGKPDGKYDVPAKTVSVDVAKRDLTITAKNQTITYGEDAPTTGEVTFDGKVEGDIFTVTYHYGYDKSDDKSNHVGTYAICPNADNPNYIIHITNGTLTVEPKELTLTAGDAVLTKTYDGTTSSKDATLTGKLALDGLVNKDAVSATYAIGAYTSADVSATKINVNFTNVALTGTRAVNYTINETASLAVGVIEKADPTAALLTVNPAEVVYNGEAQIPNVEAKTEVKGLGAITQMTTGFTKVGTYDVTVKVAEGKNYNAADLTITDGFKIVKNASKLTEVTVNKEGKFTYGDEITVTVKPAMKAELMGVTAAQDKAALYCGETLLAGPVDAQAGSEVTLTYKTTDKKLDLGKHTLTVVYGGSENLNGSKYNVEVTLAAKELTVTGAKATDRTYIYNNKNVDVDATAAKLAGIEGKDEVKAANGTGVMADANVGKDKAVSKVALTLTGKDAKFYTVKAPTDLTVTITAKTVKATVTAEPDTYTYTGKEIIPTKVVVKDGKNVIPASEYTLAYKNNVEIGTATITVTDKADGNYVVSGTGSFKIDKVAIDSITVDPDTIKATVDGATIKLTGTMNDGDSIDLTIKSGKDIIVKKDVEDGDIIKVGDSAYVIDASKVEITGYAIVVLPTKHGEVISSDKFADEGELVILKVSADRGYELKTLSVTTAKHEIRVKSLSNDRYYFIMPDAKVVVDAEFTASKDKPLYRDDEPFVDVDEFDWFYDEVVYNYQHGIMNGVDATHFNPNGTLTRGMVVTMLYRLEGEPNAYGRLTFKDVEDNKWYSDAILWAANKGIVNGYSDDAFGPNDPVTREQLAKILYGYVKYNGGGFRGTWAFRLDYPDANKVSDWAYEAMCWCTASDIINGSDGRLLPQGLATRAQAAAMFMRLIEMDK